MTAVDAYSRFLICVSLLTVAQALVDHLFVPHGSYKTIVSDQGSEFNCELRADIALLLGVQQLGTTSYRPSANGRFERVHRTISDLMAKVVSEWQDRLGLITAAYNAAHHEATGFSPFYLMYGRRYCTPIDLAMNGPEVPYGSTAIDYVDQLQDRLRVAFHAVNEHLHTYTERMKTRYDQCVKAQPLMEGQLAMYYAPQRKVDRYQKWRRLCKMVQVVRRFNDVLYNIRLSPLSEPFVAHVARLRPF